MIGAKEYAAYNAAASELSDGAASMVAEWITSWAQANPDASVAELRQAAIDFIGSAVGLFGEASAALAAEWYDSLAGSAGVKLLPAVARVADWDERAARYQAGKLVDGDLDGFARMCAQYASERVKLSLNGTIAANAERDRKKGVRFARVPTGPTTCPFCLMLASRGAVYHSRKTAGELMRFHRHCDCKVVPGFEEDPMAVLVEGFDPWDAYSMWKRVESATVYERDLYKMSIDEILREADEINSKVGPLFREQKRKGDYYGIFEPFVSSFGGKGTISPQYWAKPAGKEIQLASWLAAKGHEIEFLTPSCEAGDHTPDIRLDGELWEIKRLTTKLHRKARERISDALNQSGNVIVDLSVNEHDADLLEAAAVEMLDDPRARKILVIKDGKAVLYEK